MDAVNCISQIREHAVAIGADLVLFGGDLFHVRKHIPVRTFNAVYDEMARFSLEKIPIVMIHGNHDQVDKAGDEYSIYAFSSFLHVVDKPGWVYADGIDKTEYAIMAVPYTEDVEAVKQLVSEPCLNSSAHKIFLGHFGVQGALVGSDFVYPGTYDPNVTDLEPDRFDAVFLGHFHKYQKLAENAYYVGAPLQHNWGDTGEERGFLIYDTETCTHEFVPLKAPKFVRIDWESEEADSSWGDTKDSFIEIVSQEHWTAADKAKWKETLEARVLEVVSPKKKLTQEQENRLQLVPTASVEDNVSKYVKQFGNVEGLDEGYLIQLGQEILQETEEE